MWPFFTYFGGKWRAGKHYPQPLYQRIVEPFAGAAGYAVRHPTHDVVLVERDATIAALWRYLIRATEDDIRSLPLMRMDQSIDDVDACPEARALIGFWLNKGTAHPCRTPSAWMRAGLRPKSYWGPEIRERIAAQVGAISHWTVVEGDYADFPNCAATWFIDPPYQGAGKAYRHGASAIDYTRLGAWCRERVGQTIVCENAGAAWLPFRPMMAAKATSGAHRSGTSLEAIWENTVAV